MRALVSSMCKSNILLDKFFIFPPFCKHLEKTVNRRETVRLTKSKSSPHSKGHMVFANVNPLLFKV